MSLDAARTGEAIARLESWFETIRDSDGYWGPSIGFRRASVLQCEPGYDWRYEGILDGLTSKYLATRGRRVLDRIAEDIAAVNRAQLANGTFCNSCFVENPCEGGMPHEPAMLAAVLSACNLLRTEDYPIPEGTESVVSNYVENYLIKTLWNKQLRTFVDRPVSSFTVFSMTSASAAVLLLDRYADLFDCWNSVEQYVIAASDGLAGAVVQDGALRGGAPAQSGNREAVSPLASARIIPALLRAAARTGSEKYRRAADAIADFLFRTNCPSIECPFEICHAGPVRKSPVYLGSVADIALKLLQAGYISRDRLEPLVTQLLDYQLPNGAFRTATDQGRFLSKLPDWRAVVPTCGWTDKLYALLSAWGAVAAGESVRTEPVEMLVSMSGARCRYLEDESSLVLLRGKTPIYQWRKRTPCPQICLI